MRVLLLLFQYGFLYFFSLTAMAEISKTMLNTSGEKKHSCLVPDFRGNAFNFSSLRIMFAVGLSNMAFTMLRYVSSMSAFGIPPPHTHTQMDVEFCQNVSASVEMAFIFPFVNVVYHTD